MAEGSKRHCWECLRRCVVCDSARPACSRCTAAGTSCPGYGDVKPTRLRWLAPGMVNSRVRRRISSQTADPPNETRVHRASDALSRSRDIPRTATPSCPNANYVSITRFGMEPEADALAHAAEYCKSSESRSNPVDESVGVPVLHVTNWAFAVNVCIFQDLRPIQDLGENPYIYKISPTLIREANARPEFLRFGMLCMTLSHRMNRIRGDPCADHRALAERFYMYQGKAIRSLRETLLSMEGHHADDATVAGIVTLLLADAQQGASPGWRFHLRGAMKLVQLRGGISAVAAARTLEPQLLFLCFAAVIANTTCPASDLSLTHVPLMTLDTIMDLSGKALTPFQMCPPSLFAEIIRINHLRLQATKYANQASKATGLTSEANGILERICNFSSAQWAQTKPRSKQDWAMVGDIYQVAVKLYCVSSLQSLSVLPNTQSFRRDRTAHAQLLHSSLIQAVTRPKIKRFTLWPLVVLGAEAVVVHEGGRAMRDFVARQLPILSREAGTYVPLTAKSVLERFWASGDTGWDSCFDRSYAFVMQIAVDTSRIPSGVGL